MSALREIQTEHARWQDANFPGWQVWECFLGAMEELGEASHAYLKMHQGIRGSKAEHEEALRDAIGDEVIFLLGICNGMGWDMESIVADTWEQVRERKWSVQYER